MTADDFWTYKPSVKRAVAQNGMCLQEASDRLRDDKEVVMLAVKQNGASLL
jgi:hypothetical protein